MPINRAFLRTKIYTKKEMIILIKVERHVINKKHLMYSACDNLCFLAKNMYNLCNYTIRQEFFKTKKVKKYGDLNKELKHTDAFMELGSNAAQMVTKSLCKSWKSFLIAVKDYTVHPEKYLGKPKIPAYKKKDGRFICTLTNMQTRIKDNYLYFSFKRMKEYNNLIRTNIVGHHLSTRIIPKGNCYIIEIVYEDEKQCNNNLDRNRIVSIDLGVNNFVTMVNNIGESSIVINGKGIKSYNQYWNKKVSNLRSIAKTVNKSDWTKQMQNLTNKRYFKMEYFMHCASKWVVYYCVKRNIGTLVIGKNDGWKQKSDMHKVANQTFTQIPYESFLEKLEYRCGDAGIDLIETEEAYTSGTSFLDDELPVKENYDKSRRLYRGLFKSNNGEYINADVNGAFQIMRKVFSNVKANEIVGAYSHPVIINL